MEIIRGRGDWTVERKLCSIIHNSIIRLSIEGIVENQLEHKMENEGATCMQCC